jgi:hypothetical protein
MIPCYARYPLSALLLASTLAACSGETPSPGPSPAAIDIDDTARAMPGTPWFQPASSSECSAVAHVDVHGLAVSPMGSIAITGRYTGAPDFGAGPVDTSAGPGFVAVFAANGKPSWTRTFDGFFVQAAFDSSGNVDVVYAEVGAVNDLGGSATVEQRGPGGELRWSQSAPYSPEAQNRGLTIATAADGAVLVGVPGRVHRFDRDGGSPSAIDYAYDQPTTVAQGSSGGTWLSGASYPSDAFGPVAFLTKLGPDSSVQWSLPVRGPNEAGVSDTVYAATGSGTAITGFFAGSVTVGTTTLPAPADSTPPALGVADYLALVGDDGTVQWVREISELGTAQASGGEPEQTIAFDDQGGIVIGMASGADVAVGAFDRTGTRTWTRRYASPAVSPLRAFAAPVPGSTDVVVAGSTQVGLCQDGCDPCIFPRPFLFRIQRSGELTPGFEAHHG